MKKVFQAELKTQVCASDVGQRAGYGGADRSGGYMVQLRIEVGYLVQCVWEWELVYL